MRLRKLYSIRRGIALVVLLAVLPALFIIWRTGLQQREAAEAEARSRALNLAVSLAELQERTTESTRTLLATLARVPDVEAFDHEAMSALFARLLSENPLYVNIVATDTTGDIVAAGTPFVGINLADRKHFQDAIRSKDFAAGEFIVSRTASEAAFPFSLPLIDANGEARGVLIVALRLASFAESVQRLNVADNVVLGVLDGKGIRLFYWPPTATNPPGQPIRGEVWQAISSGGAEGLTVQEGSDGVRRIYAWRKLRLSPLDEPYMHIVVGVPEAEAYAEAAALTRRNLLLVGLAALLALALAWVGGGAIVARRIERISETAQRIARGDFDARTGLGDLGGELEGLARSFDAMAESLARRHDEQAAAEETIRASLAEKEMLLREIHHRVKNNMQVVMSLISLQQAEVGAEGADAMRRMHARVRAMALVHERLYMSRNLGEIEMRDYLPTLVQQIAASYRAEAGNVEVAAETESMRFPLDTAIPFGLLVNELVTNALKHAFVASGKGRVRILLARRGKEAELLVEDDGKGLPEGFDARGATSLGMQLVFGLVSQLGGRLDIGNRGARGASFKVLFPLDSDSEEHSGA